MSESKALTNYKNIFKRYLKRMEDGNTSQDECLSMILHLRGAFNALREEGYSEEAIDAIDRELNKEFDNEAEQKRKENSK